MIDDIRQTAERDASRNSRSRFAFAVVFAATLGFAGSSAWAQVGCQGQSASGGQTAELGQVMQQQTIEQAKAVAGLSIVPVYGGGSVNFTKLEHDGYKLRSPQAQSTCVTVPPLVRTLKFETRTRSVSSIGELDLTRSFGLTGNQMLRIGGALGWKSLDTKTADVATVFPANAGASKLSEDGFQVDLYALVASGATYGLFAASLGSGDSDMANTSNAVVNGQLAIGRGSSDYNEYSLSATVGHVFTLASRANSRLLADVSGGLLYSSYTRDGFIDTVGARFTDNDVDEFSGKIDVKLAYQMMHGGYSITPYLKGGVKHRFNYDNTMSATDNIGPVPAVTIRYDLASDDTFWRAGGGVGASFNGGAQTGVVELMYQGSGDSNEFIGRAQLVMKLR